LCCGKLIKKSCRRGDRGQSDFLVIKEQALLLYNYLRTERRRKRKGLVTGENEE